MKLDDIHGLKPINGGIVKITPTDGGKPAYLGLNVVKFLASIPPEGIDPIKPVGGSIPIPNALEWITDRLLPNCFVQRVHREGITFYARTERADTANYDFEPTRSHLMDDINRATVFGVTCCPD